MAFSNEGFRAMTKRMDTQEQKRQRKGLRWAYWVIIIITLLLLAVGSIIGILTIQKIIQGSTLSIISIIGSMVAGLIGLMLGSFQWFYPKAPSKPELSAPSLSAQPVLQMSAKPTMSPQLPSPDKTAYHGIVGFLPPTDLKTIQRREKLVKEVYAMLTQPDMTAIVLTGIGGIGKSVLAALV